jgi:protein PET100
MYIMFPIGVMYYFGTNLDNKFAVQGFWPSREQSHKIPTERQDIDAELEILKARRLALRQMRLEGERHQAPGQDSETTTATALSGRVTRREG